MLGPKRQRRRSIPKRSQALEKSLECEEEDEEKPPLNSPEAEPRECFIKSNGEKQIDSLELEEEQMMTKKLLENVEQIQAIVSENAEYATSDEKNTNHRIDSVRRQGNTLIRCLGDILNAINDLHGLFEDRE